MISKYFANICRDSSIWAGFFLLNGLGYLAKRKKVDLTWGLDLIIWVGLSSKLLQIGPLVVSVQVCHVALVPNV